jgi:histone acetyltransferase 1
LIYLAALYTAIYQMVLSRPNIAELTIEDPAEAFEDLRDRNDLRMLLDHQEFMQEGFGDQSVSSSGVGPKRRARAGETGRGKLGPPAVKSWMEKWRVQLKIAGVCQSFIVSFLLTILTLLFFVSAPI